MQTDGIIAKGQIIPVVFQQTDVAASQTDAALNVTEVRDAAAAADDFNTCDGIVMPWDFEIVAISVRASTARTAGTLTVEALINTTATGLTAVLDATNTQSKQTRQARGSDRGKAGDLVAARITTTAAWTPIAADIQVVVWVLTENLEGI